MLHFMLKKLHSKYHQNPLLKIYQHLTIIYNLFKDLILNLNYEILYPQEILKLLFHEYRQ